MNRAMSLVLYVAPAVWIKIRTLNPLLMQNWIKQGSVKEYIPNPTWLSQDIILTGLALIVHITNLSSKHTYSPGMCT